MKKLKHNYNKIIFSELKTILKSLTNFYKTVQFTHFCENFYTFCGNLFIKDQLELWNLVPLTSSLKDYIYVI